MGACVKCSYRTSEDGGLPEVQKYVSQLLTFAHLNLRECVESRHISVLLYSQPFLCDTDTSATVGGVLMLALSAFESFLVAICLLCVLSTDRTLLAGVLRVKVI